MKRVMVFAMFGLAGCGAGELQGSSGFAEQAEAARPAFVQQQQQRAAAVMAWMDSQNIQGWKYERGVGFTTAAGTAIDVPADIASEFEGPSKAATSAPTPDACAGEWLAVAVTTAADGGSFPSEIGWYQEIDGWYNSCNLAYLGSASSISCTTPHAPGNPNPYYWQYDNQEVNRVVVADKVYAQGGNRMHCGYDGSFGVPGGSVAEIFSFVSWPNGGRGGGGGGPVVSQSDLAHRMP